MRKWGNVLISGSKRCFEQTNALCWKSLKSGLQSTKMLKRADFGLKTLFWTNWGTLLKITKKWWAQCENDKSVLILGWKRCFVQTHALCWKRLEVECPERKWQYVLISGWKHSIVQTRTLCWKKLNRADLELKIANNLCAQCENDKTWWSRVENTVLNNLIPFVKNC